MIHIPQALKLLVLAASILIIPDALAGKPDKPGGGGNGGGGDPVFYSADSFDLGFGAVDSNGTDSTQLVFPNTPVNLGFTGCDYATGFSNGHLVLQPESSKNPVTATLTFWFKGTLNNGDVVSYRLYMTGDFSDFSDWPPADSSQLDFDYWEVAAENKKAQRQDCEGSGGPALEPFTVTVTR
jgi:hypothetical protein